MPSKSADRKFVRDVPRPVCLQWRLCWILSFFSAQETTIERIFVFLSSSDVQFAAIVAQLRFIGPVTPLNVFDPRNLHCCLLPVALSKQLGKRARAPIFFEGFKHKARTPSQAHHETRGVFGEVLQLDFELFCFCLQFRAAKFSTQRLLEWILIRLGAAVKTPPASLAKRQCPYPLLGCVLCLLISRNSSNGRSFVWSLTGQEFQISCWPPLSPAGLVCCLGFLCVQETKH